MPAFHSASMSNVDFLKVLNLFCLNDKLVHLDGSRNNKLVRFSALHSLANPPKEKMANLSSVEKCGMRRDTAAFGQPNLVCFYFSLLVFTIEVNKHWFVGGGVWKITRVHIQEENICGCKKT